MSYIGYISDTCYSDLLKKQLHGQIYPKFRKMETFKLAVLAVYTKGESIRKSESAAVDPDCATEASMLSLSGESSIRDIMFYLLIVFQRSKFCRPERIEHVKRIKRIKHIKRIKWA